MKLDIVGLLETDLHVGVFRNGVTPLSQANLASPCSASCLGIVTCEYFFTVLFG